MKFEREVTSERNRAFSWFFAVFSLVLMGLALLSGMPWYFCFLFVGFSAVCMTSVVDCAPCRLTGDGRILFREKLRVRTVRVSDANAILLTEYKGPERRNGAVTYRESKNRRERLYLALLCTDRLKMSAKCTDNHRIRPYYDRKGEILFTAMYGKELFAGLLSSGFRGEVVIARRHYELYRKEIGEAVAESDYDFSKVHVI